MKKLIIVIFFLLAFFLLNIKFLAEEEQPVRTEPKVEVQKETKKVTKVKHYKQKKYVPPTGKALAIAEKISKETNYPVDTISRIMFAESQYDSKAKHTNKNGSKDYGLMQINSQHLPLAKKMGIDIFTDEGNADFAIYLIKKNGLRDWGFSKHNWNI